MKADTAYKSYCLKYYSKRKNWNVSKDTLSTCRELFLCKRNEQSLGYDKEI